MMKQYRPGEDTIGYPDAFVVYELDVRKKRLTKDQKRNTEIRNLVGSRRTLIRDATRQGIN
jgi:hypothetical protein